MSHYAKIENGIVTQVIVAEKDFIDLISNENDLWIQTSYNTFGGIHYNPTTGEPSSDQSKSLRKNFAGVGFTYDETRDAFIPLKLYDSWVLNEETCLWEPPIKEPSSDGKYYIWDESAVNWKELTPEEVEFIKY